VSAGYPKAADDPIAVKIKPGIMKPNSGCLKMPIDSTWSRCWSLY
jgi:hypothetical protein